MSKKIFSGLTIFAVAFALVFGLGTFNPAKAVPRGDGEGYSLPPGQSNLFGSDQAGNSAGVIDRDRDADSRSHDFNQDIYGMRGTSQE